MPYNLKQKKSKKLSNFYDDVSCNSKICLHVSVNVCSPPNQYLSFNRTEYKFSASSLLRAYLRIEAVQHINTRIPMRSLVIVGAVTKQLCSTRASTFDKVTTQKCSHAGPKCPCNKTDLSSNQ